ncbi:helix-turn-helix transcriptional regulator [Cohnella caldifontis]|uniref:helix-turn-helix transcriptional regulator n=1 Tax=Cohnella caldifontis TaxID=3027471 RepID=UPI0023ECB984|nr:YafY family protein [Cohnella sp. YIM B05605]
MKAERLLFILSTMQAEGKVTARGLAELLEVSERTILRDLEALAAAGIPVYAERGYQGGWSLPEGYRSRLTGLTSEEISALLMLGSSGAVRDLGLSGSAREALRKLMSALPAAVRHNAEIARQRIHVDGAGWREPYGKDAEAEPLAAVQQAVWEDRKLRIVYRALDSETGKMRVVCPLGLVVKGSLWYMAAQTEEGDMRTYRVSRLAAVEPLDETFERPRDFDLAGYWAESTARFQATLPRYPASVRIASPHWPRFARERYVSVQAETRLENGWVQADVAFDTLESACGILLGYGRYAEALAPSELREAVKSEADAIRSLYG